MQIDPDCGALWRWLGYVPGISNLWASWAVVSMFDPTWVCGRPEFHHEGRVLSLGCCAGRDALRPTTFLGCRAVLPNANAGLARKIHGGLADLAQVFEMA